MKEFTPSVSQLSCLCCLLWLLFIPTFIKTTRLCQPEQDVLKFKSARLLLHYVCAHLTGLSSSALPVLSNCVLSALHRYARSCSIEAHVVTSPVATCLQLKPLSMRLADTAATDGAVTLSRWATFVNWRFVIHCIVKIWTRLSFSYKWTCSCLCQKGV